MAFPASPLPIKHELLIDGVWTDYTSRVRSADEIRITGRGYSGEGQTALSAGSCSFALENADGLFSNRNPSSSLYGLIGKNTQTRTSITGSTVSARLTDASDNNGNYDGARISTTDKAVLDITSDIDIRIDIEPDNWRGGRGMVLAAKYLTSGNQRSWLVWIDRLGHLWITWSTDGTSTLGTTRFELQSTATVATLGRQALRVTLDVDNGAAGRTATFYTSDTINGSWTILGAAVVNAGTTNIFSSSAPLEIGAVSNFGRGSLGFGTGGILTDPFVGKIYGFELRSGIGGTLVADLDATAQAAGTTSWSDGLGTPNTWTASASAMLSAQDFRFWGEVPDFPQEWDPTGTDVVTRTSAVDLIGRLQIGSKALSSAIYTNLARYLPSSSSTATNRSMVGYWTMEQGSSSDAITATVGKNGEFVDASFSADTDFPGSVGVLSFSADTGTAHAYSLTQGISATGVVTFLLYFRAAAIPPSATYLTFMSFYLSGGSSYRVDLAVNNTAYQLVVVDNTNTALFTRNVSFGTGADPDQPMAMRVMLTQNGANVDYEWGWYPIGAPVLYGASGSYASTIGKPLDWWSRSFTGKSGWWIAHVGAFREELGWSDSNFTGSTNAYTLERPDARFGRLCRLAGVPYYVVGRAYQSSNDPVGEPMGAQGIQTLMALLQECRDVDGGMLYAPRDKFGLTLRLKSSLIARERVSLDYSLSHLSGTLRPRDDPFFVKNDVTTTRVNGGTGHAVQMSGPNNTNEPTTDPQGVGTYDPGPVTRNVYADEQLQDHAADIVFMGTWDELRYPNVQVNLERSVFVADAALTAQIRHLDNGDVIRLEDLPAWCPPDDQDLLILGYSETLRNRGQEIIWNTQPYGPYRFINDVTRSGLSHERAGASNSALATAVTSTATTWPVTTPTGKLWGTTAGKPVDFDEDARFGGERVTVTGIAAWLADNFDRLATSSWGVTSTGGFTWVVSGTATDYNVVGSSFARQNLSTVTTQRSSSLDVNARISEITLARVQMPTALTGAGATAEILLRLGTSTDYVQFKILPVLAGTATCLLNQFVGGVETAFSSAVTTGLAATAAMSVRIRIVGTAAYAWLWAPAGNESGTPITTLTLTQENAVGDLTFLSSRNASSTNASPFNIEYDGLDVPRVQLFTGVRSKNGIVKAHSPDAEVQLVDLFYAGR